MTREHDVMSHEMERGRKSPGGEARSGTQSKAAFSGSPRGYLQPWRAMALVNRPGLAGVAVLVLTACGPSPEEQAFRARLAAGCQTEAQCVQLHQDAVARNQACESHNERNPLPMDQKDCTLLEEDAQTASSLLDDLEFRTKRAAEEKAEAERAAAAEDARVSALGDSCEALAAIEDAAAHAQPPRDAKYRELARTRRGAKVAALSAQIDQMLQAKPDLSDVTAARGWVPQTASATRAVIDQLRCYDGDAAAKRQSALDAWVASATAAIDKEEACRASPRCLADRKLAPALCDAIQNRRGAADDAAIAKLRAQYKAEAHVAFDDKACQSR
jgi:hypothetical protein